MTPCSAGLLWTLLDQSPAHAQEEALRPPAPTEAMDVGTAAHAYLLEGETAFVLIDAPDFRTRAAREQRDAAHAAGKTPLLVGKWAEVQAMVEAARRQLADWDDPVGLLKPEGGLVEVSSFCEIDGVAVRVTPDWHSLDYRVLADYKTVGTSAHPAAWSKAIWSNGAAVQAGLYRRACKVSHGVWPDWRWVVQESYPPYALSVVALDPEASEFADRQVMTGLAEWKKCYEANHFPAYPTRVAYAEVPGYVQAQWAERAYYTDAHA
jgi:hypothetical protein